MDEALELGEFLPFSFAAQNETEYLQFLWSAFQINYAERRFEFASLAFHLLYMSFISFSIWQIRLARTAQFEMAMVGFHKDHETDLLACESPFKFYETLKESQIFRFMKLIGCDNAEVGEFAKFVKRRNRIAHPTGSVFFNDQDVIDAEMGQMIREVRNIQNHMRPVIAEIYIGFLTESANSAELEYSTVEDEITANLIHKNYMSLADLNICAALQPDLEEHPNSELVADLHSAVQSLAATDAG